MKQPFLLLVLLALFACQSAAPFSPDAWQDHPEKRVAMSEDMIRTRRLHGKSRSEVEQLLGRGGRVSRSDFDHSRMLAFRLGGGDVEDILVVAFANDQVVEVYRIRDENYEDVE